MDDPANKASLPPAIAVWSLALLGSAGGMLAACAESFAFAVRSPSGVLLLVAVAPAIEEICKLLGLVFLLEKRPRWLRGPTEIVVLAAASAAVFATIENLLYFFVYHRAAGAGFVIYRLTVCTGMHMTASAVFGLGLVKMWRHILDRGGHFDIDVCFRYYVAAVVIHGWYNGFVFLLEYLGILRF